MKYFALLIRPVFQRTVIEVEASDIEDCQRKAAKAAWHVADDQWQGGFESGRYSPYVAEAWPEGEYDEGDPSAELMTRDWMRYAILEANLEIQHGALLLQPWQVTEQSPRDDTRIAAGWTLALDSVYAANGTLLKTWVNSDGPDVLNCNVVSFPLSYIMEE